VLQGRQPLTGLGALSRCGYYSAVQAEHSALAALEMPVNRTSLAQEKGFCFIIARGFFCF
jgi:hypothetical protein